MYANNLDKNDDYKYPKVPWLVWVMEKNRKHLHSYLWLILYQLSFTDNDDQTVSFGSMKYIMIINENNYYEIPAYAVPRYFILILIFAEIILQHSPP